MCFTPAHSENIARELVRDLKHCVEQAKKMAPKDSDGLAPLYGMAAKVPDRRIVGDFLIAYQDILLEA
jgi:sphinganine-1-phosphate aldolase